MLIVTASTYRLNIIKAYGSYGACALILLEGYSFVSWQAVIRSSLRPVHTRQQSCRKRQQFVAGNGNFVAWCGQAYIVGLVLPTLPADKAIAF